MAVTTARHPAPPASGPPTSAPTESGPLGRVAGHGELPTPAERAARGKAAREQTPRRVHGDYAPRTNRADPIDVIERQSAFRVPELVPIRYQRMMESPFRFYRGAAAIMAGDLARTPRSGIDVQLCGDAHMLNFRLLASPERHLLFDINDFDETLPGPWEWDVKRLAASMVIAGRGNDFKPAERRKIVTATVFAYRQWMRRYAGMTNLDVWYARADVDELERQFSDILGARGRRRVSRAATTARSHDTLQAFRKLTELVDGERRIAADPPLLVPVGDLLPAGERDVFTRRLREVVNQYRRTLETDRRALLEQYRLVDIARKVVGVGSVGTRCWIALMLGRDGDDPLFLQIKEADTSVLADHLPPSRYSNQGHRVVAGQRMMQAASDIFLGWHRTTGIDERERDFYVRQLRDWKGIVVAEELAPRGMELFGRLAGATLARAHARSGDRIAIAAYLGGGNVFDHAIARFAEAYADQNESDHAALVSAAQSGRVTAAA
jgi:uncharacterized protein (DUF2252 family)